MKPEEKIALEFLKSITNEVIEYEPNGNRTPDFKIGQNIAIEVRRLNKFINVNGEYENSEKLSFKLISKINNLLSTYKSNNTESEFFTSIEFKRPIYIDKVSISNMIKEIKIQIDTLIQNNSLLTQKVKLENFEMSFILSSFKTGNKFSEGITIDNDLHVFPLPSIDTSLSIILAEKETKMNPFKNEYQNWWLILIDYVGYGINQDEANNLDNKKLSETIFEKVFIVNPIYPKNGIEIKNH